MFDLTPVFLLLLAYVIGATPTSYWVGRVFFGVDLRTKGSGNLGATNTFRILGWKAAVPVALVDVFKGWFPVWFFPQRDHSAIWEWTLAYAAAAILGHVFSIWVRFKGGKGMATSAGAFLALSPWAVLSALVVWIGVTFTTRIVSAGSLASTVALTAALLFVPHKGGSTLVVFTAALAVFVFWAHRSNIGRLLRGEENRFGKRKGPPMTAQPRSIGVIGAGSWGTALAGLLAKKGHQVSIWAREPEVVEEILDHRENRTFLPGVALPETLEASSNLSEAVAGKEILVSVVPSQFVSPVFREIAGDLAPNVQVISASKGIEVATGRRMDEVLSGLLTPEQARRLTFLSGPSFATEVSNETPTAVVVASRSTQAALTAQEIFQTEYFRVYTNPDVLGVELGGALKNVIALAAGVIAGMGFGHNTLAALITRGLAEITRLGVAMGADPATFSGLAGMGDLVLTCTGSLSRNRTVGYRIGRGESLEEILGSMKSVAEGVRTVQAVRGLAREFGVEMPISEEVHALLWEGRGAKEAVRNLMLRGPKPEFWS